MVRRILHDKVRAGLCVASCGGVVWRLWALVFWRPDVGLVDVEWIVSVVCRGVLDRLDRHPYLVDDARCVVRLGDHPPSSLVVDVGVASLLC